MNAFSKTVALALCGTRIKEHVICQRRNILAKVRRFSQSWAFVTVENSVADRGKSLKGGSSGVKITRRDYL